MPAFDTVYAAPFARVEKVEIDELWLAREQSLSDHVRELNFLTALEPGLTARECQQPVDQLLEVLL